MSKDNSLRNSIIGPVIVALLVGGTAPWWWQTISGESQEGTAVRNVETLPEEAPNGSVAEEEIVDQVTSIELRYKGDSNYCFDTMIIGVGGRQATRMQQGKFVVNDIKTGNQSYLISGQIRCPDGGHCVLNSQGEVDVVKDGVYYLEWEGNLALPYAAPFQCTATISS